LRKAITGGTVIGLLLLYRVVAEVLYIRYIHGLRIWSHVYVANQNWEDYLIAWLMCILILLIFKPVLQKPLQEYKFSEYVILLLLLFSVFPGMAMCGVGVFSEDYTKCFYLYWILFFVLARAASTINLQGGALMGRFTTEAKIKLLACIFFIFMASVIIVFCNYGGGFFFSFLQSQELYSIRLKFREISMPIFLGYIKANAAVVFLFFLMFFLKKKRYFGAGIVLLLQWMQFSCGAQKIHAVSTLICLLVYGMRHFLTVKKIIGISIGGLVVSMGIWDIWNQVSLLDYIRRVIIETNLLCYYYYEYFQVEVPMLFRLFEVSAVDRANIPFAIGSTYFGDYTNHANSGLFGDAYMMFGGCGLIFGPVFCNLYLYFMDKASRHIDWWIKLGLSVFWSVTIIDSSLMTNMLSHGGILLIILSCLYVGDGAEAYLKRCSTKKAAEVCAGK